MARARSIVATLLAVVPLAGITDLCALAADGWSVGNESHMGDPVEEIVDVHTLHECVDVDLLDNLLGVDDIDDRPGRLRGQPRQETIALLRIAV